MWSDARGGLFLFSSPGEGQRSVAQRLGGELAEAAACGGVRRRRHEPRRPEETSWTSAAGSRSGCSFSFYKYSSDLG